MNAKRFITYLAATVMLAGTLILPATASAHGLRDHGQYRERHVWHEPAPKWRHHQHRHERPRVVVREYVYTPRHLHRHRSRAEDYVSAPRSRFERRSGLGFSYWDYKD